MTKEELLTKVCIDFDYNSVYDIFKKLDNYETNLDYIQENLSFQN